MEALIKFYLPEPYNVQGSFSIVSPLVERLIEETRKVKDSMTHLFGYLNMALKEENFNDFNLTDNYKIGENTEEEMEVKVSMYYSRINSNRFIVAKISIVKYGIAELLGLAGVQTSIDLNNEFSFEKIFQSIEEIYAELKKIIEGLRPPTDAVKVVFIAR